jgi:hypothetical protein
VRRKSLGAKSSGVLNGKLSTSQPWPSGLYATYVTPSSRAVSISPSVSCSVSKAEYSAWSASILATTACQRTVKEARDWRRTRVGLAERLGRALGQADVLGLSLLPKLIKRGNRLLERRVCKCQRTNHSRRV